jgi:hypothetical protein
MAIIEWKRGTGWDSFYQLSIVRDEGCNGLKTDLNGTNRKVQKIMGHGSYETFCSLVSSLGMMIK